MIYYNVIITINNIKIESYLNRLSYLFLDILAKLIQYNFEEGE